MGNISEKQQSGTAGVGPRYVTLERLTLQNSPLNDATVKTSIKALSGKPDTFEPAESLFANMIQWLSLQDQKKIVTWFSNSFTATNLSAENRDLALEAFSGRMVYSFLKTTGSLSQFESEFGPKILAKAGKNFNFDPTSIRVVRVLVGPDQKLWYEVVVAANRGGITIPAGQQQPSHDHVKGIPHAGVATDDDIPKKVDIDRGHGMAAYFIPVVPKDVQAILPDYQLSLYTGFFDFLGDIFENGFDNDRARVKKLYDQATAYFLSTLCPSGY